MPFRAPASGALPRRFRRPLFTQDQWPQAIFWLLVFVVIAVAPGYVVALLALVLLRGRHLVGFQNRGLAA